MHTDEFQGAATLPAAAPTPTAVYEFKDQDYVRCSFARSAFFGSE
jgi:hypothetical protein